MQPLPEWLYSRYARMFDVRGEGAWTLRDAVQAWGDTVGTANVALSEMRKRGHAVLVKRAGRVRMYRLISPSDFLFASLHLSGLDGMGSEAYKPFIIKTVRGLRKGLGSRLTSVGLFGSVARGEASLNSDVDLYVVAKWSGKTIANRLDEAFPWLKVVDEERFFLVEQGIVTDASVYPVTPEESLRFHSLQLDLSHEGIVIYDTEGFLARAWEGLRTWLARQGVRRVQTEGGWFWQLDPETEVGSLIEVR